MERHSVIIEAVADIRRKPVDAKERYIHDELQETQAIYNEMLLCREEMDEWVYIEAIEQKTFRGEQRCQGYPGWIKKSKIADLNEEPKGDTLVVKKRTSPLFLRPSGSSPIILNVPLGARLWMTGNVHKTEGCIYCEVSLHDKKNAWIKRDDANLSKEILPENKIREGIAHVAELFLGIPYLWGGRSIDEGVDCSGLVNLVYRANNIDLPRDSHDQWMATKMIYPVELEPGDLIFTRDVKHYKVSHVMLYTGGDEIIEAYETGGNVRRIGFRERFGLGLKDIAAGREILIDNRCIYFCRIEEFA